MERIVKFKASNLKNAMILIILLTFLIYLIHIVKIKPFLWG